VLSLSPMYIHVFMKGRERYEIQSDSMVIHGPMHCYELRGACCR
jgi:hypothetical protein